MQVRSAFLVIAPGAASGARSSGPGNASSCLDVSGELDLSLVGAGCPSAPLTGSLQVTGTFTANANGAYTDDTTT